MKKIIVTGATSFIGLSLIEELSNKGYEVLGIVRKNSVKKSKFSKNNNVTIVEFDMDNYENISLAINKKYDTLYHLAWDGTRGQDRENIEKQNSNYINSLKLINQGIKLGCKKIIISGSQAEYGNVSGIIKEDMECNPVSEYGRKKLQLYKEASKLCRENNISLIEARFFSVYGCNDYKESLISSIITNMSNDKECFFTTCTQMWNYLYIDDAVEALIRLGIDKCPSGVYNVASYDTKQLKDFIYIVKNILRSNSTLHFGKINNCEVVTMKPDISKIKTLTTWRPKIDFEEGINKILKTKRSI